MNKITALGFFNIDDTAVILKQKDLMQAKVFCFDKIETFIKQHPQVKPENVTKTRNVVTKAKTIQALAIAVGNFVLAHPSENLKVSK